MRGGLVSVVVAGLLGVLQSQALAEGATGSPRAILRQAIDLYVEGRYQQAVQLLRPLVENKVLSDRADQLEALRTYGISLHLVGAKPGAGRAFRELLRLDPQARLDPSFVRPEVVGYFNKVRRQFRQEQRALERRGTTSAAVNLLPPWGQFRHGHQAKAYSILGAEVLFGATSITTAALLYAWRDDTGQFGSRERYYKPLSYANYISFGVMAAVVLYGVIDGLYHHYRR